MKTTQGPRRLRVLVVDDERLIRWAVSQTLTAAGHAVAEADSATAALRAVSDAGGPDVVLLDYHLPDSIDLTLLSRIRQLVPKAAVIMMTAVGTPEVIAGAHDLGAYRVLSKPFDLGQLPSLVLEASAPPS